MSTLSKADRATHESASYVRRPRTVLARFSAGNPRGSWPAEEYARQNGAEVEMDLDADDFLVIVPAA